MVNTAVQLEHRACDWGSWKLHLVRQKWMLHLDQLFSHRGETSDARRGQVPCLPTDQYVAPAEIQPSSAAHLLGFLILSVRHATKTWPIHTQTPQGRTGVLGTLHPILAQGAVTP